MTPPHLYFDLQVDTTCLRCGASLPEPDRDEVRRALSDAGERAVVLEVDRRCRCGSNRVRVAWRVET